MSTEIDEKIVQMRFDNKQFESNVAISLATLDELKKSLDFDGVKDSFNTLSRAANGVDFSKIQNGVESLENRFSASGIVMMSIIEKITDVAISAGGKIFNALSAPLNQIYTGGVRRAQNIEHAKFQLEGLKVAWEDISDTINESVAGTAYGLDEAAVVASQLVASQVPLGDSMLTVLKAVAGVAAMTSSEYSDIGRVFTTVAGNGRLMSEQLMQLSVRGLNAAATIAEYLHVTEAEVRDMVSDGQISFEIFSAAMSEAFGEQAAKANETFSGSLSNVKAALSRIGAEVASPALTNLRDLFNSIRPVVDAIHEALMPLINNLNAVMKAATDAGIALLEMFPKKINGEFFNMEGINNFFAPLNEFTSLIAKTSEKYTSSMEEMANVTEDFGQITQKEMDAAWEIWTKGTYGTGEERRKALEAEGLSYERVQKYINDQIAANWTLSKSVDGIGDSVNNAGTIAEEKTSGVRNWVQNLFDTLVNVKNAVANIFSTIGSVFQALGGAFLDVFSIDDITGAILKVSQFILRITEFIKPSEMALENLRATFRGIFSFIHLALNAAKTIIEILAKVLSPVIRFLKLLAGVILNAFSQVGELLTFVDEMATKSEFFATIGAEIINVLTGIGSKIMDVASNFAWMEKINISGYFFTAWDAMKSFFSGLSNLDFKSAISKPVDAVVGFAGKVKDIFSPKKKGSVPDEMDKGMEAGTKAMSGHLGGGGSLSMLGGVSLPQEAYDIAFGTGTRYGEGLDDGLDGMGPGMSKLDIAKSTIVEAAGMIHDSVANVFKKDETPTTELADDIEEQGTVFSLFADAVSKAVDVVVGVFKGLWNAVKAGFNELDFSSLENFISSIGSAVSTTSDGAIETVTDTLSGLLDVIEKVAAALPEVVAEIVGAGGKILSAIGGTVDQIRGSGTQLGRIIDTIFRLIENILNYVADNPDKLIEGGIFAGVLKLLLDITGGFNSFGKAAKNFTEALNDALGAFVDNQKKVQKELNIKFLQSLALAIVALAGAFWIMSKIDYGHLAASAAIIGGFVAEIFLMSGNLAKSTGATITTKKGETTTSSALQGVASTFLALGIAIGMVAKAIKKVSTIDAEQLKAGTIAIASIMVVMGLIIKLLGTDIMTSSNTFSGVGASSISGTGIGLTGNGMMGMGMVGNNRTAISANTASKTGETKANDLKGVAVAFLAMGVAIKMVGTALSKVAKYDPERISAAGWAIAGIIAEMSGLMMVVGELVSKTDDPKKVGDSMLAFGGALDLMALALDIMLPAIGVLALIPLGAMWKAVGGIAGILAIMSAFIFAMGFLTSLFAKHFGVDMKSFSSTMLAFAGAMDLMALALGIMLPAIGVLALIPTDRLFTAIGAMAVILFVMTVFIGIIGAISASFQTEAEMKAFQTGMLAFAASVLIISIALDTIAIALATVAAAMAIGGSVFMEDALYSIIAILVVVGAIVGIIAYVVSKSKSPKAMAAAIFGLAAVFGALAILVAAIAAAFLVMSFIPVEKIEAISKAIGIVLGVIAAGLILMLVAAKFAGVAVISTLFTTLAWFIIAIGGSIFLVSAGLAIMFKNLSRCLIIIMAFAEYIKRNEKWVDKTIDKILKIVKSFGTVITSVIEGIITGVIAAIEGLINWVITSLPRFIAPVSQFLLELVRSLDDLIMPLIDEIQKFIDKLLDKFLEENEETGESYVHSVARRLTEVVGGLITGILSGLTTSIHKYKDPVIAYLEHRDEYKEGSYLEEMVDEIGVFLAQLFTRVGEDAERLGIGARFIDMVFGIFKSFFPKGAQKFIDEMGEDVKEILRNIGKAIVPLIKDGMVALKLWSDPEFWEDFFEGYKEEWADRWAALDLDMSIGYTLEDAHRQDIALSELRSQFGDVVDLYSDEAKWAFNYLKAQGLQDFILPNMVLNVQQEQLGYNVLPEFDLSKAYDAGAVIRNLEELQGLVDASKAELDKTVATWGAESSNAEEARRQYIGNLGNLASFVAVLNRELDSEFHDWSDYYDQTGLKELQEALAQANKDLQTASYTTGVHESLVDTLINEFSFTEADLQKMKQKSGGFLSGFGSKTWHQQVRDEAEYHANETEKTYMGTYKAGLTKAFSNKRVQINPKNLEIAVDLYSSVVSNMPKGGLREFIQDQLWETTRNSGTFYSTELQLLLNKRSRDIAAGVFNQDEWQKQLDTLLEDAAATLGPFSPEFDEFLKQAYHSGGEVANKVAEGFGTSFGISYRDYKDYILSRLSRDYDVVKLHLTGGVMYALGGVEVAIATKKPELEATAEDLANSIGNKIGGGVMAALGVHSPSTVAMWIMEMFGQGLVIGVENSESALFNVLNNLSHGIVDEVDPNIEITPTLNLSDIDAGIAKMNEMLQNGSVSIAARTAGLTHDRKQEVFRNQENASRGLNKLASALNEGTIVVVPQDSTMEFNTVMDGEVIARHSAPALDVITGRRNSIAERNIVI